MSLNLTKPAEGSVGWAAAINQNFTDIQDVEAALGEDFSFFRQAGTSPFECWYPPSLGPETGAPVTTPPLGSLSVDTLYAFPYFESRGGTLDRIAFKVTTGGSAGSVARAGIYRATSLTNLYPDSLVADGGQFDTTTTGTKVTNISVALSRGLYWLAFLCGTAAPTVRSLKRSTPMTILGMTSDLDTVRGAGLQVSQSYGALPSTFPSSATIRGQSDPYLVIAVRYSA